MAYTPEEIIELVAIKVQEVIVPKVEAFTDGVDKEVQKLRLQYAEAAQFNSAIQRAVNTVTTELAILEPMKKQITELYALFCKNGYMQKFNSLHASVNEFFRTRFETCPVVKDVREMRAQMDAQKTEAVRRAEGKLLTREGDARVQRRWRVTTYLSLAGVVVAGLTLATKLLGWW